MLLLGAIRDSNEVLAETYYKIGKGVSYRKPSELVAVGGCEAAPFTSKGFSTEGYEYRNLIPFEPPAPQKAHPAA
ncbi:hypothetical protein ZHAS_00003401 [Anopheles sinensis]|uniref:Uncharacterized protein n=1 Tax=Anopheles sinensis TaxID=74873 RepID=A0A084VE87_ANOSI|nr:hypothetical protein ZHAS_00003401 [Anopheles sinensis]